MAKLADALNKEQVKKMYDGAKPYPKREGTKTPGKPLLPYFVSAPISRISPKRERILSNHSSKVRFSKSSPFQVQYSEQIYLREFSPKLSTKEGIHTLVPVSRPF